MALKDVKKCAQIFVRGMEVPCLRLVSAMVTLRKCHVYAL